MTKRVCVIGGGISGLCVAYHLKRAGRDVVLFESSDRVGGNIRTEIRDKFLIEHGPNTVLANRELIDLLQHLDIVGDIARPDPQSNKRYILKNAKLVALPTRILALISNNTFSRRAKLRMLQEPFAKRPSAGKESIAEFFERRFGKEIADYAVDPFISGIYAGNPAKLSLEHAFPRLFDLEKRYGSLIFGMLFTRKDKASRFPKNIPRSFTFKSGMQMLIKALERRLGENIRINTTVNSLERTKKDSYTVGYNSAQESFDAIVICTPAPSAANLVRSIDPPLSDSLSSIYYPPIAVIYTAYKKINVKLDPDGFGFLVPSVEKRQILGSLWTSSVFAGRAPEDYHLFTTFVGGSRNPQVCNVTDEALLEIVDTELRSILQIDTAPDWTHVKRWERAIPQYNIGYEMVVDAIERCLTQNPGIFICSNFYKGISVADCIKNAGATAMNVNEFFNK